MIERYSRPEMANIWTEENKYRAWLEVEILADEAWAELGEIPKEDVALIREKADFDIDRILEIEQQTRHDVVAFTRAVSETLGEERKWVHYGLTSTDVVDTAYGYLYKQANDIIRKDLENFLNEYRQLVAINRKDLDARNTANANNQPSAEPAAENENGNANAAEEETVAEEPKKHTHTAKMKSKPIDDEEEDEYEDEEDDEEEKGGFFGKLFGKKKKNIDFDDDDFDDEE